MNDLTTLHEAFGALADRADALPSDAYEFTVPTRSRTTRVLAPAVAVAAVVATAGAVAIWQSGSSGPASQVGGASATPVSSAAPTNPSSSAVPTSPSSSPTPTTPGSTATPGAYAPPTTSEALAARARSILAGIATITVIKDAPGPPNSQPPQPSTTGSVSVAPPTPIRVNGSDPVSVLDGTSGSSIRGTLTAGGRSGGYDLNVFATTPGSAAACDSDEGNACTVRRLPNGDSLAFGVWHDPNVGGGLTYDVEVVRTDGAEILLHLSNEDDPKGMGTVTADRAPLTEQQLIDVVTSPDW